jgi:peptide/nickel transport system substrate-binding protein
MIFKRRLLVTAVATALTLSAAACGSGGSTTGGAGAATGKPVAGGSATVLTLGELRTLDPGKIGNNFASGGIQGNALYGTLLTDDPTSGKIQYSMAEQFSTADKGKTFVMKLRDGLTFSDGSPLTAEAVKFNWDRMKDPATASPYRTDASMVASADVVDQTTLRITMREAVPNFAHSVVTTTLNWIASPAALAAGPEAFDANPIGAGPFTLKEWRRQDAMELVKNPKYWDAPKPYLDNLTLKVSTDATQRVNTVISGGADVAVESSWQNLKRAEQAGLPTNIQPLSGGNFIALNMRRAPFDDIRARTAFAAAIDPQTINVSAFDGAGELVDTVFAKNSPFHSDIPVGKPDKATAQRLFDELAAAGKPVSFAFTTSSTTEARAQAESVQAQLSAYRNVKVSNNVIDVAQFPALQSTHDFDAIISSAAFIDPEPRLWTAFSGEAATNMPGLKDAKLDAALNAGRTATSVDERKDAYDTVQKRLTELHPLVWLGRTACSAISTKEVGGLVQYGFGSLRPEEIWVRK